MNENIATSCEKAVKEMLEMKDELPYEIWKEVSDKFVGTITAAAKYAAYGNAWNALTTEQAKTGALQSDATNTVLAFRTAWMQGNSLFQALLQDPGLQEMV